MNGDCHCINCNKISNYKHTVINTGTQSTDGYHMKPYAIDLFCGAGGMSEGILQAGFHILFSSDINESVEKTYTNRHKQLGYIQGKNTYYRRADIRDLTGESIKSDIESLEMLHGSECPEIDAIFGGPPCQGFSRAGRRNPNDPRNMLFKEYVRVIDQIRPKYVVVENVAGFVDMKLCDFIGHSGGLYKGEHTVPELLQSELTKIGYDMKLKILNAADYGVPQRRNRVIVLANRHDVCSPEYPKPITDNSPVSLQDAIGDLVRDPLIKSLNLINGYSRYQLDSKNGRTPDIHGKTISSNLIMNDELPRHANLVIERFSLFEEDEEGSELRERIKKDGIDLMPYPELTRHCSESLKQSREEVISIYSTGNLSDDLLDILLTKKTMRRKMARNVPAPTVVTMPDDYINPFEPRTFSVREMARLQSFDDSFEFLGKRTTGGLRRRVEIPQYSQVGNAVPPLLAKAIAVEVLRAIKNK